MNKEPLNMEYINCYNNGMTIWEIAENNNTTYKKVYEGITGNRFEARFLPYNEKSRICDLYINGMSTVKIGLMYGVNNKPIAKVLEEYNINRNNKRFVRKYNLDEHYFDKIDTSNKAYILGFLLADGCNSKNKGTVSMSLQEEDVEILEKIRREIKSEKPLEYINNENKHDFGYTYKNQYRLLFFSIHMCNTLEKIGIVPNKSLIAEFPNIPECLYKDLIRGIFDGDGSVSYKEVKNHLSFNVNITGTYNICYSIQSILLKNRINSNVNEASNHNGITATLVINKNIDKIKFLQYIYDNSELYLKRKYDKYIYILNNYSINNKVA